jgi:hypothetical protein
MKMNARRRSPVMLAVSVLAAWLTAPGAAAGGRRNRAGGAAAAVPCAEIPAWRGTPTPAAGDTVPVCTPPTPRLSMLFQTGWQHAWPSSALWDSRHDKVFSLDLGMLVRGDDGHRWGGAVTGFWYSGHRRVLGVKGIRRWTLEEASDSYLQLAPGVLAAGEDERVDLRPGLLLEAELGNRWVALATGLHVQPWAHDRFADPGARDVDVIWTLGGRVHGAIGIGMLAVVYLSLVVAFASSSGGWD